MFCILGHPSGGSGQRCMCGFIGSKNRKNQRGATKILFFQCKKHSTSHVALFTVIIGKTYMFEHRNPLKNLFRHVLSDFEKMLKIDLFERCVSGHFPIAYGGTHMKLLNLELFISNITYFLIYFLLTSMFSLLPRIQALAPPP